MTVRLSVKAQPGASRNEVAGFEGEVLRVRVTAPPERGKANQAVIEELARALGLPRGRITLVRGAGSRRKVLEIEGLEMPEIRKRLG